MTIQEAYEYIKSQVPSARTPGFRINFGKREALSVEEADELIVFLNKLENQKTSSVKPDELITKTKIPANEGKSRLLDESGSFPISEFVRQRNEVLFSLDRNKIESFYKERGQDYPENDVVFWAGVYKSLLAITTSPQELREKATNWLTVNGFSTEILIK